MVRNSAGGLADNEGMRTILRTRPPLAAPEARLTPDRRRPPHIDRPPRVTAGFEPAKEGYALLGTGAATARKLPMPTLTRVEHDLLWRGKAPELKGSKEEVGGLAQRGFKSIVSLRTDKEDAVREGQLAKKYGMNFLNLQVDNRSIPKNDGQVVQFLDFLRKPENQPCYLHCAKGKGRTGIFAACYRLAIPSAPPGNPTGTPRLWTVSEALAEARANGLSSKDQQNYVRQFAAKLAQGKIAGYPLAEAPETKPFPDPNQWQPPVAPPAAPALPSDAALSAVVSQERGRLISG